MTQNDINVDKAIMNVINLLKTAPLIIHSEADLRALLHNELFKQDKMLYETSNYIKKDDIRLKTNRVHCEYHNIDVVVFGKEYIKDINFKDTLLFDSLESGEIFCDSIIELKVETGVRDKKKAVKNDFKKLRDDYEHFFNKYGKGPALYLFFHVFSNPKKDYENFLRELLELSIKEPVIYLYLDIGPKSIWKEMLEKNVLDEYKRTENAFLEFTI